MALGTLALLVLAVMGHAFLRKKAKRIVGAIGCIFALIIIVYATVLSRSEPGQGLVLIPGYSFLKATYSAEYLRMVLMNIAMFVPWGVFLSMFLCANGVRKNILITLGVSLGITVLIECIQYFFSLGCAELDDVICNMIGAAIGIIPYGAAYPIVKKEN